MFYNGKPGSWKTVYSTRGFPHQVWEQSVPRISESFIEVCIYLYPSAPDAEAGVKIGGSGFLVSVPVEGTGLEFTIAVTNRHIIEDGFPVIRINTADGRTDCLEYSEIDWIFHPNGDDLAICLLPSFSERGYKYRTLQEGIHFVTTELIDELNIGIGDEVFVTGRFVNQEGKQQNQPSVRFGNIAQMPSTVLSHRLPNGRTLNQESFIAEARSIAGYSGSPVFVMMDHSMSRLDRGSLFSSRILLLGINWAYIRDFNKVFYTNGHPNPALSVEVNTGMMAVIPAWKLSEMLKLPIFDIVKRKVMEEHLAAAAKSPVNPTGH